MSGEDTDPTALADNLCDDGGFPRTRINKPTSRVMRKGFYQKMINLQWRPCVVSFFKIRVCQSPHYTQGHDIREMNVQYKIPLLTYLYRVDSST